MNRRIDGAVKLLREHVNPTFELRQIEAGHHDDSINKHQQKHYHQMPKPEIQFKLPEV
uniref:Uncharacterized protein n=1 Tax=Hyaloperonospora arabidopsidis (strain Emoy2) TaxID=559515 RepID=M4BPZ2_HYAAE